MANIMQEIIQAADDVKEARDTLVADTAKANAVIRGPVSGTGSTVDLGAPAGVVKSLARVMREAAGRVGLQYRFAAAIDTTVDPGGGYLRGDATDLTAITEIAISASDVNALGFAAWIETWDHSTSLLNRGRLFIQLPDGSAFIMARIVGATIDGAGFYRLQVSHEDHAGAIADDDEVSILFVPSGDRGGNAYTVSVWLPGDALPAGGESLIRHYFETDVFFAAGLPGWQLSSRVAAPEDAIYTIWKLADIDDLVGVQFGTATLADGTKTATFTGSATTCAAGTYLDVRAPDPPVAGLLDVTITATGTLP